MRVGDRGVDDWRPAVRSSRRTIPDHVDGHGERIVAPAPVVFLLEGATNRRLKRGVESRERGRIGGAKVDFHPRFAGDRVDRGSPADPADAECGTGHGRHFETRERRDGKPHGVHGIGSAEVVVTMAAGTAEGDAVPAAADARRW